MNILFFGGCRKIGWVKIGCSKCGCRVLAGIRGGKNGEEGGHNGRERVETYRRGCEIFFGLFINMFGCWRRRGTGGLCRLTVGLCLLLVKAEFGSGKPGVMPVWDCL